MALSVFATLINFSTDGRAIIEAAKTERLSIKWSRGELCVSALCKWQGKVRIKWKDIEL